MKTRFSLSTYIILALIAIGLFARFLISPVAILVPVIVFGAVFLLYKYPPSRFRRRNEASKYNDALRKQKQKEKRRTRNATFRVIRGNKDDDPEDPPRYH